MKRWWRQWIFIPWLGELLEARLRILKISLASQTMMSYKDESLSSTSYNIWRITLRTLPHRIDDSANAENRTVLLNPPHNGSWRDTIAEDSGCGPVLGSLCIFLFECSYTRQLSLLGRGDHYQIHANATQANIDTNVSRFPQANEKSAWANKYPLPSPSTTGHSFVG